MTVRVHIENDKASEDERDETIEQVNLHFDARTNWRHDIQHNDTRLYNTRHKDTQWIFTLSSWRHDIQHNDTQHNDTHHKDSERNGLICDTQRNGTQYLCLYAECRYTKCCDYLNIMMKVIMPSVIMLSAVMLNVVMLKVVMLNTSM